MNAGNQFRVKLSGILLALLFYLSGVRPATGFSKLSEPEPWVSYQDPYGGFQVFYPGSWTIQPIPYRDFGFRISSPDIRIDPTGRPLQGVFFSAQVKSITTQEFTAFQDEIYRSRTILRQLSINISGEQANELSGVEKNGCTFIEQWLYVDGFLYDFRLLGAPGAADSDRIIGEKILASLKLAGARPRDYPYPDTSGPFAAGQFQFPAILHAYQAGPGRILFDYDLPTHTGGDDFAFDLCEGMGCVEGSTNQYVLAPTDMTLVYSGPGYGMPVDSLDYHIFEVDDDGVEKLCLSIGHFQIMLPGLTVGKSIPQHSAIGQLSVYTSIPHIHMGLWTSPVNDGCAGFSRLALPFSGAYKLDGGDYPAGSSYAGISVSSHNSPSCAPASMLSPGTSAGSLPLISPGDCFPPCPQIGGVILYKNAVYACNAEGADQGYILRNYETSENIPIPFNDAASSILVPAGWSARLYEHADRAGGTRCINAPGLISFFGETFDNGTPMDNQVSSFEVSAAPNCPGQPATDIVVESSSTHVVHGNTPVAPEVRIHPVGGSLDPARGDSLVFIGGSLSGASSQQTVKTHVNDGESYSFQTATHPGFAMVAPSEEGAYSSQWQLLVNGTLLGPIITIPMLVDNAPPTVSVISPVGPYLTSSQVLIQASVQDTSSGVAQVQFMAGYDDGQGWGWVNLGWDSDGSDGWGLVWETTSVPDQAHAAIYAFAWDRAGNGQGATVWDLSLDRNPPKTTLQPLLPSLATTAIVLKWDSFDAGSGVGALDIQLQQDGDAWQDWQTGLDGSTTSATFVGIMGHSYGFRIRGIDRAGHIESYSESSQGFTSILNCTGDANEPDNDLSSAVDITTTVGAFSTHNLCGVGDQDWVRFWGNAGVRYVLETLNLGSTSDTILGLYASDGTLLAENDDITLGHEKRSRISWIPSVDNWLYARVRHADANICGDAVRYDLRLYQGFRLYLPASMH